MRENKLIQFYLTDRCNSRCKTCTIWKNKEHHHLSTESVFDIMQEFPKADYVLGGGEFTLYKYKEELLRFCNNNNINYTVLSNAVDFNRLDYLIKTYGIKNLTMSWDGKNHDKIRGITGNTYNIVNILHKWRDKINIKLAYTYSRFNEDNVDEDMKFAKETLSVDKLYLCIGHDVELLGSTEKVKPHNLSGIIRNSSMFFDKDIEYVVKKEAGVSRPCDSTSSVFTIYTNGDIVRCQSYMSTDIIGNVNIDDMADVVKRMEDNRGVFVCPYDKECGLLCQRRYD